MHWDLRRVVASAERSRVRVLWCDEGEPGQSSGRGDEGLGVDGGVGEGERVGESGDGRRDDGVGAYSCEGEDAAREDEEGEADAEGEEGGEADGAKGGCAGVGEGGVDDLA